MYIIGLLIGYTIMIFIVWVSALIVRVKSNSFAKCALSFSLILLLGYGLKLVVPEGPFATIISLPVSGYINSVIFKTTYLKGILMALITGVIMAAWVITIRQ